MPSLVFESVIACTPEELWAFHSDVSALRLLTPPGDQVTIIGEDTAVREGALHVLRVKKKGLTIVWKARISNVEPPHRFVDTAEKSPFAFWRHTHEFLPHEQGSLLRDSIEYRLPLGPLGAIADALFVRRDIEAMFRHRHTVTAAQFRGE